MILRQLLHTEPVIAASYFVACGGKRAALVVDPVGSPEPYLDLAKATNTTIRFVVDTHVHADHHSTGPALAAADAPYVLHAEAGAVLRVLGLGWVLMAWGTSLPAQGTSIVVRPLAHVSADAPSVNHAEAWLAVDPRTPSRAVVASLADSGAGSVVYFTTDSGKTWRRGSGAGPEGRSFPGLDPVVIFDQRGTAYLSTISPFKVWRSADGGATWQGPAVVPGRSYDREYLAIRSAPDAGDTIYALAKTPLKIFGHLANDMLALARSTDGGQSFEAPRFILPDPTKSIIHTAGGLIVASDGKFLVSFMAHDVPVADVALLKNHIWLLRSQDGREFAEPTPVASTVVHGNRGDQLKMGKSLAMAGLAMDTAQHSPHRGRLYLSFVTVLEDRLQVMVAASNDTGRTWDPPVRVNDDRSRANHSNVGIAVDGRGVLGVVWNDRRADPTDLCFRATITASTDGGRTFLPNQALVAHDTCPVGRTPPSTEQLDTFGGRYLNGGETQALAAVPGGGFLVVFIAEHEKAMQLHAAIVDIRVPRGR